MAGSKHAGDFEVIERDLKTSRATTWLASCKCGSKYVGPTYEAIEDKWREHVHAETGTAPDAWGEKEGRWMPS